MAYDEELAERIRGLLDDQPEITERRMFGGLAWLVQGNMAVAALGGGGLMVRVPADQLEALVAEPGASPMEMRGRPMRGWIRVTAEACDDPEALTSWVGHGLDFAATLPAK